MFRTKILNKTMEKGHLKAVLINDTKSTDDSKLQELKDLQQSSKVSVSKALDADERNEAQQAIAHYISALQCLEKAVSFNLDGLSDEGLKTAHRLQSQMVPVMKNVQSRLYELQEAPLGDQIESMDESGACNAAELLSIPGGVQLFTVNAGEDTPPPSYPTSLVIYVFDDLPTSSSRPPGFIKVDDWVYPLTRTSPVLHCSNGAYVFPDVGNPSHPGNVGLVISSSLNSTYEEVFKNILENMACLKEQQRKIEGEPEVHLPDLVGDDPVAEEEPSTSQKIASGIETSASWLSWGLSKGAELTSSLIKKGTNHLQKNISPDEQPMEVNPTVKKGLYYTHEASKVTVKVSYALVKGLSAATSAVAKSVAPHVKSLLPSGQNGQGDSNMAGVITVVDAGLIGVGNVWKSLEDSGMLIARTASSATVGTVQHKYGADAGQTAGYAVGAAVNCGRTVFNIDSLGIKAIAKRTAKDTGKTVLKEFSKDAKKPL